ncbi:unnamed protein product, partial [Closterium sp. Naga37s-1]
MDPPSPMLYEGRLTTGEVLELEGGQFLHYEGRLTTGEVFDSSREDNAVFTFEVGKGKVIRAWDIGIKSMKVGDLAELTCQSDYAYGDDGSPPEIPPGATLVFEVELMAVRPPRGSVSTAAAEKGRLDELRAEREAAAARREEEKKKREDAKAAAAARAAQLSAKGTGKGGGKGGKGKKKLFFLARGSVSIAAAEKGWLDTCIEHGAEGANTQYGKGGTGGRDMQKQSIRTHQCSNAHRDAHLAMKAKESKKLRQSLLAEYEGLDSTTLHLITALKNTVYTCRSESLISSYIRVIKLMVDLETPNLPLDKKKQLLFRSVGIDLENIAGISTDDIVVEVTFL